VKSIPDTHLILAGGVTEQRSIYKADKDGKKVPYTSRVIRHRLDHQGMTSEGTSSPNRIKRALIHSIMHPARDKVENEYLRKRGLGSTTAQGTEGRGLEKEANDALSKRATTNPLPWMSEAIDLKKEKNFFETSVTGYQTGGALSWEKKQASRTQRH